jgi:hypothetical protein
MATPRSTRNKPADTTDKADKAQAAVNPEIEDAEIVAGASSDADATKALELTEPVTRQNAPEGSTDHTYQNLREDGPKDDTTRDPESQPQPELKSEPQDEPPADRDWQQPTAVPVVPAARGGSGFFPLLLGGVAAAAIGFGLARYVLPGGWPMPDVAALEARLAEQDTKLAAQQAVIDALFAPMPAPEVDLGPLTTELADLRAKVESVPAAPNLSDDLSALTDRITELEQRGPVTVMGEPADIGPVEAAIAAMQTELAALKSTASDAATAADAARVELEAAQAKAAKAAADAAATQAQAAAEAQTLLIQASLAKLDAALQSGAPFADVTASLVAEGVDVPAVLADSAENGVPTVAALTEGFEDPARAALDAAVREDVGTSATERFSAFLRTQTGARSIEPREGDDADAVLSRIGAAVKSGDLTSAMSEVSALPASSQEALAAWVAQVQTRIAAAEASAALSAQLGER